VFVATRFAPRLRRYGALKNVAFCGGVCVVLGTVSGVQARSYFEPYTRRRCSFAARGAPAVMLVAQRHTVRLDILQLWMLRHAP
jgi:hypothetical protein